VKKQTFACEHCGAEADMTLAGFERVEDVVKREKKTVCKVCGKETTLVARAKETLSCKSCGAEADMTLNGFENVEDVIQREKKLVCQHCGKDISWTNQEDLKAVRVAMEAEKTPIRLMPKQQK